MPDILRIVETIFQSSLWGSTVTLPLANFVQQSILYMRISGRSYLYDPLTIGGIGWGNKENTQHISDGSSTSTCSFHFLVRLFLGCGFLEFCESPQVPANLKIIGHEFIFHLISENNILTMKL